MAIRCKHCHADLSGAPAAEAPAAGTPAQRDYGAFLIAIPVAGAALAWFWVGNMMLIQSPGSWLWFIAITVIAATAILAQREDASGGSGDAKWPVTMALVWVVAYPAYLHHRESRGLRNLLIPGVVAALLFIGSLGAVQWAINAEIDELNAEVAKFEAVGAAAVAELDRGMAQAEAEFNAATAALDAAAGTVDASADMSAGPAAAAATSEPAPDTLAQAEAGVYAASDAQTLWIESITGDELKFTLTLGSAAGIGCEEGVVDCTTVEGVARRAGVAYRFESGDDCAFTIGASETGLAIADASGACGTGTANRHLLASIEGAYARYCRDADSDTWRKCE